MEFSYFVKIVSLTLFIPGEGGISPLIVCHVTPPGRNKVNAYPILQSTNVSINTSKENIIPFNTYGRDIWSRLSAVNSFLNPGVFVVIAKLR